MAGPSIVPRHGAVDLQEVTREQSDDSEDDDKEVDLARRSASISLQTLRCHRLERSASLAEPTSIDLDKV